METATTIPTKAVTPTEVNTPTATETSTPTEIITIETIQTSEFNEIAFDTSKPEAVTVDGQEYQGYLVSDYFGTRLVDNTNSILLIQGKDGSWKVPESENYPGVYFETNIGNSDGFEIPITIGLSASALKAKGFGYTQVHITQEGADDLASAYLNSAWLRYKNIMNHPDVTYDQYLALLKEGKGDLEIIDSSTRKPTLVDPRKGYNIVITGDPTSTMALTNGGSKDGAGSYLSTDETGRIVSADNRANEYYDLIQEHKGQISTPILNTWILMMAFSTPDIIASTPDICLIGDYPTCLVSNKLQNITSVDELENASNKINGDYRTLLHGTSKDPLFTLK
jgi:hypothetical protein